MEELERLEALPEDQRGEDYDAQVTLCRWYRQAVGKVEDELIEKRGARPWSRSRGTS
jgi:hypothetical protein